MKVQKDTIIRTVIMLISLVNSVMVMLGKTPLPWENDELYGGLSAVLAVLTTLWSWWKNNSFTQNAIKADAYMKELMKNEDNGC